MFRTTSRSLPIAHLFSERMTRKITIKKESPSEEEPDLFRSSKCNTLSYKSAVSTTTVVILIENTTLFR